MKIWNISKNNKMYFIGDVEKKEDVKGDQKEARWYLITAKIADEAKKFKVGDDVDIKSSLQGSSFYLNFIGKIGTGPKTETPPGGGASSASSGKEKKYWGKSPEERNDIKRQAIAHATSRVLQGAVTPDNVIELIEKVYKKFVELVG